MGLKTNTDISINNIKILYKALSEYMRNMSSLIRRTKNLNDYALNRHTINLQLQADTLITDLKDFDLKTLLANTKDPDELKEIEEELSKTLTIIKAVDSDSLAVTEEIVQSEKEDVDTSTESQDLESQNILSKNMEWGYYKGYSSLCHADSLCLAHDLNSGVDINYTRKEEFLNYAKSKKWIFENGWVDIDSLIFTQEYAKATNTKPPTSKARLDDNSAARYGQAISWIPDEKDKNHKWHKVHKVVWDFDKNNVYFNPWTRDNWSHNLPYKPRLRFKY